MSDLWHGGDAAHCSSTHWIGCHFHRKAQLRNRVLGQDPEQCSGAQGHPLAAALQPTPCRAQATQETSQSTSGRWGSHAAPIAAQELCRLKRLSTKDERPVRSASSDGAIPRPRAPRWQVGCPTCCWGPSPAMQHTYPARTRPLGRERLCL